MGTLVHDQTVASAHRLLCNSGSPGKLVSTTPGGINVLSDVSRPDIRHLVRKGGSAGTYLGGSGISQTLNIVSIVPCSEYVSGSLFAPCKSMSAEIMREPFQPIFHSGF